MERSSNFLKKKSLSMQFFLNSFLTTFSSYRKKRSFSCVMAYQQSPLWTKMDENTPEISIETTGVLNYI